MLRRTLSLLAFVVACAPRGESVAPAQTTDSLPSTANDPRAVPSPPADATRTASGVVPRSNVAVGAPPTPAPPTEAIRTATGLAYVYIRHGTGGARPTAGQKLVAHYTGWTTDGNKFDSSRDRGEPIEFEMNQVIQGWTEALQLMVVGDSIRVWIPEALAYKGKPGRPAGLLIFDIELIEIR